jgi:hypothetical protein
MGQTPIDLVEKYSKFPDLRVECIKWGEENNLKNSGLFDLGAGDLILFRNGFGVPMIAEIMGFSENGEEAFLHWDCYWFPVKLRERFIQKTTK